MKMVRSTYGESRGSDTCNNPWLLPGRWHSEKQPQEVGVVSSPSEQMGPLGHEGQGAVWHEVKGGLAVSISDEGRGC